MILVKSIILGIESEIERISQIGDYVVEGIIKKANTVLEIGSTNDLLSMYQKMQTVTEHD